MPLPIQRRIANLEERLSLIEMKQGREEPQSLVWRVLERDRRETLHELGLKRGCVQEQESRHAQRAEIARKEALFGGPARGGFVTAHPTIDPPVEGRRLGGL